MDLICTACGEPWDLDYVLHEEPGEFRRDGAAIVHCPCCEERSSELSAAEREKLAAARELGQVLGDDVDGYAAELEDLEQYFAQRQVEEEYDRELIVYSDGRLRRAEDVPAEELLKLLELSVVQLVAAASTFPLGEIVATRAAFEAISASELLQALARHARGDWGDVDDLDRQANDQAVREGSRLFSVYQAKGVKFWVITEADRSATTVLLPENY